MNTYRSPMPWMPRVADFTEIPNMGVVSLSCSIRNATIKVKGTFCSSPSLLHLQVAGRSAAENVSAACFDITAEPLE